MNILSLFSHPHVIPNMNVFFFVDFMLNIKEYILKNTGNQTLDGPHLW